jgi:hypothetical protein
VTTVAVARTGVALGKGMIVGVGDTGAPAQPVSNPTSQINPMIVMNLQIFFVFILPS